MINLLSLAYTEYS